MVKSHEVRVGVEAFVEPSWAASCKRRGPRAGTIRAAIAR